MSALGASRVVGTRSAAPNDPNLVGEEWLATLHEVALFEGLSKRHLRRVAKLARIRRFASGSTIVRAGDAGSSFFVVLDGTARVVPASGRARRLGVGDCFGEMSLLDGAPRSADVIAEGEVLALMIGRSAFGKLLRKEPALMQVLLRTLAARLRAAERSRLD
jgi:CRP-like cAMP-binding protein